RTVRSLRDLAHVAMPPSGEVRMALQEFRLRLYPHLPLAGFRLGFAFPVARPFVCECRTIPAIPCPRTIPGLPESLTLFPTVSPAHTLVRRSGTHAPSSP